MTILASYKKTIGLVCSFVLILPLVFPDVSLSKSRIDMPAARLDIGNAVPLPLIEKIARVKSRETWGPGALGDPVPLSDLNGNVVAYMFSFQIGADNFSSYDEIMIGIRKGRDLRDDIKNSRMEKAGEAYEILKQERAAKGKAATRDTVVSNASYQLGQMEPIRPDGTLSRRVEVGRIREMEKFAARKAIGDGEYGTIIVSATYNNFPVPAYLHYLAPYYTQFDLALEKAEQVIGQGAVLKRIYFMGLDGQYFEFVNDTGSIVMNCKTLEITDRLTGSYSQPVSGPPVSSGATSIINEDIANAWGKIRAEAGE